jgi:hypothetical protein
MTSTKDNKKTTEKSIHDIRSHLSVILSASELAILQEADITREAALDVIKTAAEEVNAIMRILDEKED